MEMVLRDRGLRADKNAGGMTPVLAFWDERKVFFQKKIGGAQ